MTVQELLQTAQSLGLPRLDAQRLLLHVLGQSVDDRAWLLTHDRDAVDANAQAQFESLQQRYRNNEPMGYLLGEQAFYGLHLQVDARVLVPRPDTETLVDWALEFCPPDASANLIDLGTGSGAIALAVAKMRPMATVHASDESVEALTVAQRNATQLGLNIQWHQGSWWQALDRSSEPQQFDLVLSNPPYIAQGDPHLPGLRHEPISALTAGPDGLDDIRTIISGAPKHLRPGAWILLEHGYDQAKEVAQLLEYSGFVAISHRQDLAGHVRCTGGQWPNDTKHR